MPEKYRLLLAAVGVVLLLLLYWSSRRHSGKPGQAVVAVPVSQATYFLDGKPDLDDEVLHGQTVTVIARTNRDGRVKVRTQYGYQVELPAGDLRQGTNAVEKWRETAGNLVIAPWASVQERADLHSFPPLITLPRGSVLAVLGQETAAGTGGKEYAKVELADGRTGFVRPESLRTKRSWNQAGEEETRRQVVEDALSYLGVEYRWGGKTPAGIDCSGLASMAYMLNGLDIYRNSRPEPGYPLALLQVKGNSRGGFDLETLKAGGVKQGDLIFWRGHMALYLGNGKYVHANATTYNVTVNSLCEGDADYRPDLGTAEAVFAWGTAWPAEPNRLKVGEFRAVLAEGEDTKGAGRVYRFYAKASGYVPNRAVVYPEGYGQDLPKVETKNPRFMLYDAPDSANAAVPRYQYPKPGLYRPALELINDAGWLPDGKKIRSEIFVMDVPIRVD